MSSFLDSLLDDARERVLVERAADPTEAVRERALAQPAPPDFHAALAAPGVAVIAEIKRASPSKGDIAPDLDAATQAAAYRDGGAAAISVLTEPDRFKGTIEDLRAVTPLGVPTLRKDFTVDAHQIWQARDVGAAAILLIVAALDDHDLRSLHDVASEAGVTALVEVHDEAELERATAIGARIIGVNARDLRTFDVDRDAFGRLRQQFPVGVLSVAESGVRGPDDVRRAGALGADAILVGETLVRAADPRAIVASLVAAGLEHDTPSSRDQELS